ncbi:TPA: phage tail protein [Escherichia coli]|nr:phage tail protein [Escherichia coli]
MANLPETPQWEEGVYQIEVSDPVLGGPDGISNRQAKQLASRTSYLKQQVEKGGSDLEKHIAAADPHTQYAPKASPTFTGNPAAPTVVKTDNSTKLATTAHVKTVVADYAPLASPGLTGIPTAPTAAQTVNNTQLATTAFVKAALAALVASSPAALDTLNELAAALGNDPNFATTMTNALAGKQPLDNTLTALSGKSVAALLEYLGLGEARYVIKRGTNANGAWIIWSDGAVEVFGSAVTIVDGLATVTFPVQLPAVTRNISIAERISQDPGVSPASNPMHVSIVIDNTVTTTGFKARCVMASGMASSNGFSWRVYAPV